jgi:O-antigen/teichoic acid export membrane protein
MIPKSHHHSSSGSGPKDPLSRNSALLLLNYIIDSILTIFFWLIAAEFYPKHAVGMAAALFSSIFIVELLSKLGLDYTIIRFFPQRDRSMVLGTCISLATVLNIFMGLMVIVYLNFWPSDQVLLKGENALIFLLILITFLLIDLTGISFIAMQRPELTLLQTLISNSAVLFLLSFIFLGAMGILASALAALIVAICVTFMILSRLSLKPALRLDRQFLRDSIKFSIKNYISDILILTPKQVLAIITLSFLGADVAAHFWIACTVAALPFLIPTAISLALLVEGCNTQYLKKNVAKSLILSFALLTPAIVLLYNYGGSLLAIIGRDEYFESYIDSLELMKVMVLSSFFIAVVDIYFTVKRVQREVNDLIFISCLIFALITGLSYMLIPRFGLVGAGYAWLVGYGIGAVAIMPRIMRANFTQDTMEKQNPGPE